MSDEFKLVRVVNPTGSIFYHTYRNSKFIECELIGHIKTGINEDWEKSAISNYEQLIEMYKNADFVANEVVRIDKI